MANKTRLGKINGRATSMIKIVKVAIPESTLKKDSYADALLEWERQFPVRPILEVMGEFARQEFACLGQLKP